MKSYFDLEKVYLSSEYEEETSVWTRIQKQKYRGNSDWHTYTFPNPCRLDTDSREGRIYLLVV